MRWHFLVIFCIIALGGCLSTGAPERRVAFHVGVGMATVNPADGTFLGGYGYNRRSTGIHDPLYAKAVVFYDGQTAVALLVIDSLSLQYNTVQAIRAAASRSVARIPLPPSHIIVQSTHTHSAPDTIGIYGPDPTHTGRTPEYMADLVKTGASVVAAAVDRLEPARIVYAETECKGWAVNDVEPDILDNSVTILACLNPEGRPIATLTNFACHPTVLDGDNTLVSSDWVGMFYKTMGEKLVGEHLFLQGAIGCWIQPVTPERTFALAEKYGRDLGQKTLAALKEARSLPDTRIRFASARVDMPVENEGFRMMTELGLVERDLSESVPTEVAWFAIGPAQFATHLAETAPEYAEKTRALMNTGPKFILGLGLDHLGYICPPRYFEQTGTLFKAEYLTRMSPGPQAGPAMMTALESIIPYSGLPATQSLGRNLCSQTFAQHLHAARKSREQRF